MMYETKWYSPIIENTVYLGAIPLEGDEAILVDTLRINGVLSLNEKYEFEPTVFGTPINEKHWFRLGVVFENIPTPDYTAPTMDEMERGSNFIASHLPVYVHCRAGRVFEEFHICS